MQCWAVAMTHIIKKNNALSSVLKLIQSFDHIQKLEGISPTSHLQNLQLYLKLVKKN